MGIRASTFNGHTTEAVKQIKKEEPAQPTSPLLATIKRSVGLKFSNGYEFNIFYENGKMIISANLNGKEAFYLDEIPEEFIDSLRRMLE